MIKENVLQELIVLFFSCIDISGYQNLC